MLNEEKQLGYWLRTGDFITLRRPIVKLDTLNGSIKAELPKQLLKEMTMLRL